MKPYPSLTPKILYVQDVHFIHIRRVVNWRRTRKIDGRLRGFSCFNVSKKYHRQRGVWTGFFLERASCICPAR